MNIIETSSQSLDLQFIDRKIENLDQEAGKILIGSDNQFRNEYLLNNSVLINFDEVNRTLRLRGTRLNVSNVYQDIQLKLNDIRHSFEVTFKVDKNYHSAIIGRHGRTVKSLMQEFRVIINIPSFEERRNDFISIRGEDEMVRACREEIASIVYEIGGYVDLRDSPKLHFVAKSNLRDSRRKHFNEELVIHVPKGRHSRVIGREGNNIKELCAKYDVDIRVPALRADAQDDRITIRGNSIEQCEQVAQIIDDLTKPGFTDRTRAHRDFQDRNW